MNWPEYSQSACFYAPQTNAVDAAAAAGEVVIDVVVTNADVDVHVDVDVAVAITKHAIEFETVEPLKLVFSADIVAIAVEQLH